MVGRTSLHLEVDDVMPGGHRESLAGDGQCRGAVDLAHDTQRVFARRDIMELHRPIGVHTTEQVRRCLSLATQRTQRSAAASRLS